MNQVTTETYSSYTDILSAVDTAEQTLDEAARNAALDQLVDRWLTHYHPEIVSDEHEAFAWGLAGVACSVFFFGASVSWIAINAAAKQFDPAELSPIVPLSLGVAIVKREMNRVAQTRKARRLYTQHNSHRAQAMHPEDEDQDENPE